jgi:hypothetical protein
VFHGLLRRYFSGEAAKELSPGVRRIYRVTVRGVRNAIAKMCSKRGTRDRGPGGERSEPRGTDLKGVSR